MKNILVVGSSNTDMVVKTSHFPNAGETVVGGDFFMFPGGKGANQAVAAVRMGGEVKLLCKIGCDLFGQKAEEGFVKEGIQTDFVLRDKKSNSGIALITVNQEGENSIVVAPGSNHALTIQDIDSQYQAFEWSDIALIQLEIPIETAEYAIEKAHREGVKVILNPAPARKLRDDIYAKIYLITPNESETELLTGIVVRDEATARQAAKALMKRGVQNVIITLGAKGAYFLNKEAEFLIDAFETKVTDTTAAGDVFNGALAVALSEDLGWKEAIQMSNKASSIAVSRMGAQSSAPYRKEVVR